MSHVTHMNESCHTYEWSMSGMNANSNLTHINTSCHTYENVVQTFMSRLKECRSDAYAAPPSTATCVNVWHESFMCDITYLYEIRVHRTQF